MVAAANPFANHPELRDKISDPLASPMRTHDGKAGRYGKGARLAGRLVVFRQRARGRACRNPCRPSRNRSLGFRLRIFDVNPALRFEEVRRAHVPGYARQFILKDIYGGRGTVDKPGLMAALDKGPGCDGLAFRISRENIEEETKILWQRKTVPPILLSLSTPSARMIVSRLSRSWRTTKLT